MSTPDPRTIAAYRRHAQAYAERFATARANPGLDAFIALIPKGGRVLDLGCGPGHAAAWMAARGLEVDALDASPEMAALARDRFGIEVRVAGFDAVTAKARYDGIWASFSLLHAPKADFPRHLAALNRALKPGGLLHLGMKLGQGEGRDRLDRFYAFYSRDELAGHLDRAGYRIEAETRWAEAGLEGTVTDLIRLTARAA